MLVAALGSVRMRAIRLIQLCMVRFSVRVFIRPLASIALSFDEFGPHYNLLWPYLGSFSHPSFDPQAHRPPSEALPLGRHTYI